MIDYHLFQERAANFLFFPASARLYQLSKEAVRLLCYIPGPLEALDASAALRVLSVEAPADQEELYAELRTLLQKELTVAHPATALTETDQGGNCLQTFSLYLAQTCNMSCCYCWNRGGSFGKSSTMMEEKTAQLVTELILSLVEASSAEKCVINFYGGEPLLNFPALKEITLRLRQEEARLAKHFCFTVDTNGSLLTGDTAQFLARHFSQIGVSLDGRQEVHDRQRPALYGEPTWRTIVDNLMAFPNPELLGLRATLTSSSDSYADTFCELSSLGLRRIQIEYCHEPGYHENPIYQRMVVPPERQNGELLDFVDEYVDTISHYKNSDEIPFTSSLMDNITKIRRGNRFTKPCGAGMSTLAINSAGEVFPCIAFVDRNEFIMGRAGTPMPLSLHTTLAHFAVDHQKICQACWLRYDCAGGCYATRYDMTGQTRQPHPDYCQNMKAKAEVYLYAMARMLEKCPWHLDEVPGAESCTEYS